MLNDDKRPKRTPPGCEYSPGVYWPGDIDLTAWDAAMASDEIFEQDLILYWLQLFTPKTKNIEKISEHKQKIDDIIDILFRLFYEYQRFGYTNEDAAEAALKRFLRYC